MKFKEMNLPNKLTTIRMFCVPFMVVLFVLFMLFTKLNIQVDVLIYSSGIHFLTLTQILMAVLFAFASITDFVDGHLARKHNLVSDYGKLMDPLADKLLVNTTILCMLASGMYISGQKSFIAFEIFSIGIVYHRTASLSLKLYFNHYGNFISRQMTNAHHSSRNGGRYINLP